MGLFLARPQGRCAPVAGVLLAGLAALLLAAAAHAGWPERKITVVVPFPAGGLTDVAARRFAAGLQAELGQSVVVENRVGAGGIIGTEYVARAKADGYTLLVNSPSHVINQAFRSKMPYDALGDFTPVAMLLSSPMVLVVNPAVPVTSLAEYLAYARGQEGGVSFGSTGAGGTSHLAGEMLRYQSGAPMTHIPYKGASPALNDLLGNQLPSIFLDVATMAQYVASGKVRPLAISSATRSEAMPQVPTVAEQGFPAYDVSTWIALYAPARLPGPILHTLNAVALKTMGSPKEREWLLQNGATAGSMTAPQFSRFVGDELAKWSEFNRKANVKID